MIVTSEALRSFFNSIKVIFNDGMKAESQWGKVATEVKSSSGSNVYAWLSKFPKMREWIGERVLKSMKTSDYTLHNRKFEATVDVDRADFEDDNLGIYKPIFEQMGQSAVEHIDENVFAALADGFTKVCFDGKPYFSAEHPLYPNVDGTGDAGAQSNCLNPTVTDKSPWFVIDASKPMKPVIYQNRSEAELHAITDVNNDKVFMLDKYLFGSRARRAFGYSYPQLAVGCRDSLTAANFEAAVELLESQKTDGNRPLGIKATTLVVPPNLKSAAKKIVDAQLLSNGASNINYKSVEIVVSPYLVATPEQGG